MASAAPAAAVSMTAVMVPPRSAVRATILKPLEGGGAQHTGGGVGGAVVAPAAAAATVTVRVVVA